MAKIISSCHLLDLSSAAAGLLFCAKYVIFDPLDGFTNIVEFNADVVCRYISSAKVVGEGFDLVR